MDKVEAVGPGLVVGPKVPAEAHAGVLADMLHAVKEMIGRLDLVQTIAVIYEAYPEIKGDVDELLRDIGALVEKIKAL